MKGKGWMKRIEKSGFFEGEEIFIKPIPNEPNRLKTFSKHGGYGEADKKHILRTTKKVE